MDDAARIAMLQCQLASAEERAGTWETIAGAALTPKWKHGCPECRFLGHLDGSDLYVCPQWGAPTIVARHSDDLPDYTSGQRVRLAGLILSLYE